MNRRASGGRAPRVVLALALSVVVVTLAGYGVSALHRVVQIRHELEAQERELAALRQRTDELTRTVERLRSDPAYVEKLAREDLGLVREGETVLKFPRQTPPR